MDSEWKVTAAANNALRLRAPKSRSVVCSSSYMPHIMLCDCRQFQPDLPCTGDAPEKSYGALASMLRLQSFGDVQVVPSLIQSRHLM